MPGPGGRARALTDGAHERAVHPRADARVLADDDLRALLATCAGRDFVDLRDTALLRLFIATGGRRAEAAGLTVDAVELDTDPVRLFGKGRRERQVTLSPKTAQALERYLRARRRDRFTDRPELWLAERCMSTESGRGTRSRTWASAWQSTRPGLQPGGRAPCIRSS